MPKAPLSQFGAGGSQCARMAILPITAPTGENRRLDSEGEESGAAGFMFFLISGGFCYQIPACSELEQPKDFPSTLIPLLQSLQSGFCDRKQKICLRKGFYRDICYEL